MQITINDKDVTAQCADLIKALDRLEVVSGRSQAVVMRGGAFALLKSLRKQTIKADKFVPRKDVRKYTGDGPKWITRKGKKPLRRFTIVRKAPSENSYGFTTLATSQAEARRKKGKIGKAGLAKKSWGHVMNLMFQRSNPENDTSRVKIEPGMVDGYIREITTGTNPRVEILIENNLEYIKAATSDAAVSEAINAATRNINGQIQRILDKAREQAGLA